MSRIFRQQHQHASSVSRRLRGAFWFGLLLSYGIYVLLIFLILLIIFSTGSANLSEGMRYLNKQTLLYYSLLTSLVPTIVVLNVYHRRLTEMRAQRAEKWVRMMGAKPLQTKAGQQRRFANLVAEMQLAAGRSEPELFILPRDESINAFLIAGAGDSTALVISQGALDSLTRDELQALVAYQFGHLKDGYLPIFSHLTAIVSAYYAIIDFCTSEENIRTAPEQNLFFNPLRSLFQHPFVAAFPMIFGAVFYFYGQLLQAAFSRQRVLMADARAIEFTRQDQPFVRTLQKALALEYDGARHPQLPRHYAHIYFICYQSALHPWLQTHPDLLARIHRLGGRISEDELEALHFEMQHHRREDNVVNPVERHRAALADQLVYPLLSVDRLIKPPPLPPPEQPLNAMLALFIYHSQLSLFEFEKNVTGKLDFIALAKSLQQIEKIKTLEQIPLLAQFSDAASLAPPAEKQRYHQIIKKLLKLTGKPSDYQICLFFFWQKALHPRIPRGASCKDLRDDIGQVFSYLIFKNQADAHDEDESAAAIAIFQRVMAEIFPASSMPTYQGINADPDALRFAAAKSALCLRKLSPVARKTVLAALAHYFEEQKRLVLSQVYWRYTLEHL